MSNRNAHVFAIAGAAALAGFGYTLARRSGSRAARATRASSNSAPRVVTAEPRPNRAETPTGAAVVEDASDPVPWQDGARISSSPDALDLALNLDDVFDGNSGTEPEVTARPNQHVPALHTVDDDDAPAPEDLGAAWLKQATESERSLGFADTLPELENLRQTNVDRGEDLDSDGDGEDDDETTAEYVRRHRISSVG